MKSLEDEGLEAGAVLPAVRKPDLSRLAEELVSAASDRGIALTGEDGLLTALTRQVLQSALEVEMSHHLGYDRNDPAGRNGGSLRNGSTPKTVTTEIGKVTVEVPPDRRTPSSRRSSRASAASGRLR